MEELVVRLDVVQLEIGERALVVRAPVDDAVVAVEVALFPEVDEVAQNGAHVALVHREALAPVVHRRAHAPELGHDRAAVLAKPFPDACFERLATQLLAGRSLALEVLLDHALRRDARVVVAWLEQAVVPLHAAPPNQRVRERELERVAEMEIAGDVRRREGDDVRVARVVGFGGVQPLVFPGLLPAGLDALGRVQGIHRR